MNLSDKLNISTGTDIMALVIYGHFLQGMLSSRNVRYSKIKSIKLAYSLRHDTHWSTINKGEEGVTQASLFSLLNLSPTETLLHKRLATASESNKHTELQTPLCHLTELL